MTIDDSEVVQNSMYNLFKDIDGLLWIGHAYTVEEAFELIKSLKPQMILLDIKLHNRTGFEVLKFLKEKFPEITTIILSNFTTEPFRKKSFELGAKYFLDKSQEFEKIPEIIASIKYQKVV